MKITPVVIRSFFRVRTALFTAGLIAALVLLAAPAQAQRAAPSEEERAERLDQLIEEMTEEVGLSSAQADDVRQVLVRQHEALHELRSEARDNRSAMREEMKEQRAEYREEISAVLTEEQQERFETLMKEKRESGRRGKRRGGRRGGDHQQGDDG